MLKIGQLSLESGVSIKTIRYYEELGLIQSPERTEGQFRLFTPDTVHRLLFVKRLQSLGLSLRKQQGYLISCPQVATPYSQLRTSSLG
jgi:DNA-binding transcriptional MerR regulator